MTNNKTLIIVPMKDPYKSKSRLKGVFSIEIRKRLAVQLYSNTLRVLNLAIENMQNNKISVMTKSEEISNIAVANKCIVIGEGEGDSLSNSLQCAAKWSVEKNFSRICIVPADLADPHVDEIKKLLSYPIQKIGAVICPSIDYGTNALFLSPPNKIKFKYGKKSFFNHFNAAKNAKMNPVILPLNSLRYDVDTLEDVRHFIKKKKFLI